MKIENFDTNMLTPCRVFGSDKLLTEPEDILYYHANIQEFEAYNRLLGDIRDDGQYVIKEGVRKNLAALPKELADQRDGIIEAHSYLMTKNMFFSIELDQDEENQIASLYLTEPVQGYGELDHIKTFIAKITSPKVDDFVEQAKKAFNIQPVLPDINEGAYMDLIMQIQEQIDFYTCIEDLVDLSSQIYVLSVLALLEEQGEVGQKIITQYNKRVKELGLDKPNVKKRYSTLRKILDKEIQKAGGEKRVFKEKETEYKKLKQEYSLPIKRVEQFRGKQIAVVDKGVVQKEEKKETKKNEKKLASKGKTAGNKKADKAKSGGAKKKAKSKSKGKEEKKKEKKAGSGGGGGSRTTVKAFTSPTPTMKSKSSNVYKPKGIDISRRAVPVVMTPPPVVTPTEDAETEAMFSRLLGKGLSTSETKLTPPIEEIVVPPEEHAEEPIVAPPPPVEIIEIS